MIGAFIAWSDNRNSPGYVIDGNGCHIWIGATTEGGYGKVWSDGKLGLAHRVRYEREVGPIPDGLTLDHYVCNNGAGGCCNPLHCRPVTQRENLLRGEGPAATNRAKTHCKRGHPLEGDNLLITTLKRDGSRSCRTCHELRRKTPEQRAKHAARERERYRLRIRSMDTL